MPSSSILAARASASTPSAASTLAARLSSDRASASSRWWLPTGALPASCRASARASSAAGVRRGRVARRTRSLTSCSSSSDRGSDALESSAARLTEHLGGHALALAHEPEQDVLGADVVVAELQRLAQRELEHLLGPRRERDVAGRRLDARGR